MSVPTHPLLALVDASKNDLKVSLTNYIDLQVEKTFGQLRNRIVYMIEHGEMVLNARVLPQANTSRVNSTNQQSTSKTLPSESLLNTITTTEPLLIKQECLDSSSTTVPLNVDCIDVKYEYDDDDYDDEGEYMSDCDECEDCVKGICGLVGENNDAGSDVNAGVDTQIGINQPNASLASDLAINIIQDVIDGSNYSSDKVNGLLLTNESKQQIRIVQKSKGQMTVQKNVTGQFFQPAIEHNQQSMPSTSGAPSAGRKRIPKNIVGDGQFNQVESDKRNSTNESSKGAKKAKLQNVDEIHNEEETKLQVVTLELNCTEPGCMTILNSFEMWKQHLSTFHGQIALKHLEDNVRINQHGQTEYDTCTECNTMHKSEASLRLHWRNYHQAGKFECSVCAFVANFRSEVKNHQQQIHRSRKFQCTQQGCNKAFKYIFQLEQHGRIHNGERPFSCIWDNCQSTFNQLCAAIKHVRTIHFHLPRSIKKQKELNIIDERDPKLYVQM